MKALPKPIFSPSNPFWYRAPFKRLTGQDFSYAWTWEMLAFNLNAKLCVAVRMIRAPIWKYLMFAEFKRTWRYVQA